MVPGLFYFEKDEARLNVINSKSNYLVSGKDALWLRNNCISDEIYGRDSVEKFLMKIISFSLKFSFFRKRNVRRTSFFFL